MILVWWSDLELFEIAIIVGVWILLNILITAIFLKIALTIVDAKHTDFGEVFVTSFVITALLALIFVHWIIALLMLVLIFYFIAKRHDIGFCMAIIVAILAFIIAILVIAAVLIMIGIVARITIGIGSLFS
ncbi:MAG: hypothetical protein ACFFAS_11915 [Promethearchaeota archaeon]